MCPVSTINLRYSQPNKSHSDQREYNPVRVKFTQDSRIRNNDNSTFLAQWSNALFYIYTMFQVFHHTWPYYILKAQEIYHMCLLELSFCRRYLKHHYTWYTWIYILNLGFCIQSLSNIDKYFILNSCNNSFSCNIRNT